MRAAWRAGEKAAAAGRDTFHPRAREALVPQRWNRERDLRVLKRDESVFQGSVAVIKQRGRNRKRNSRVFL